MSLRDALARFNAGIAASRAAYNLDRDAEAEITTCAKGHRRPKGGRCLPCHADDQARARARKGE